MRNTYPPLVASATQTPLAKKINPAITATVVAPLLRETIATLNSMRATAQEHPETAEEFWDIVRANLLGGLAHTLIGVIQGQLRFVGAQKEYLELVALTTALRAASNPLVFPPTQNTEKEE